MGFSVNDGDVRVDIFKETGQWYTTISVNMEKFYNHTDIHKALLDALSAADERYWYENGYQLVCIEPYHKLAHPISLMKGKYHDPKFRT